MDNELATRLIKARSDKGWSQADLANESGVAAAQISRYEQGRSKPRPEVLAKLARAMGVDFNWLSLGLSITDDPPPIDLFLDAALHSKLSAAASASGRSMQSELVYRLQNSFESDKSFEMLYELRRTQLQLQLTNLGAKNQALKWRLRELLNLIEELDRSNVPEEGLAKLREELGQVRAAEESLEREELEVMRKLLKLDDEHSDRFELWEDQVSEREARKSKP